jgi:hypothetical protein
VGSLYQRCQTDEKDSGLVTPKSIVHLRFFAETQFTDLLRRSLDLLPWLYASRFDNVIFTDDARI